MQPSKPRSHVRPSNTRIDGGSTRERVLAFVRDQIRSGTPPTIREVAAASGLRAVESARAHLDALVASGRLVKSPGKSRGYRLVDDDRTSRPAFLVPMLGRVQAGELTTAVEAIEGHIAFELRGGYASEDLFALRVRGDSMIGAGILHDDIVIVHRRSTAQNKDIVVALVDDEATVKTLHVHHGRVELHAHNPNFEAIVVYPSRDLVILGKVIEVRRSLS